MSTAKVTATWTFVIKGPCTTCGKKCQRTRHIVAAAEQEAAALAQKAQDNLQCRRCLPW